MTLNENYKPLSAYLLNFFRSIENMPEIGCERLEKKCGTASLKMINNGSRRTEWLDGTVSVRQNFEISYRTAGNDNASRMKALKFLEQLARILEHTTEMDIGSERMFIKVFRTDFPVMSVRCTGGEEEYSIVFQLMYVEI